MLDLITFTFARSSGPGGQNVNKGKLIIFQFFLIFIFHLMFNLFLFKVNTKVDMRFNLNEATWIPEYARKKLAIQVNSF